LALVSHSSASFGIDLAIVSSQFSFANGFFTPSFFQDEASNFRRQFSEANYDSIYPETTTQRLEGIGCRIGGRSGGNRRHDPISERMAEGVEGPASRQ
jgi:hypothetical protein